MLAARQLETAVSHLADAAWHVFQTVNRRVPAGSFQPVVGARAAAEELRSARRRRSAGRARPIRCARRASARRARAFCPGDADPSVLVNEHVGEIKAHILERDGKIIIEKTCPQHGTFTDVLAINPAFLKRIEGLFPGRDYTAVTDRLHNHGTSSIKYGRGSVLTVDLTNRCNMMCDPCFMDANQVGYVHELTLDDVKKILDDSLTIKPRRQLTVQFSGGEPTISPIFLDAVAYARQIGYFSAQAATNGIRFAQDPEFAMAAAKAGLRIAYLQFDGVGEEANAHRKVGNLFDVKLRAIENLHRAGIDIALVVTIVRTVNDDQVGRIVKFAVENCDKISFVSFQPVSFTGRDEDIDDRTRAERRYTLSHLAEDIKTQTGATEPLRDWFPLSAAGAVSDVTDLIVGPGRRLGHDEVRLPPELRHRHGAAHQQEDEEVGAAAGGLRRRALLRRRADDRRRGARPAADEDADGAERAAQLPRRARAGGLPPRRSDQEVRQAERRRARRRRDAGRRQPQVRRVARPLHRRDVVPGSVDLRFPAHRDVHHPVRDADGRDLVLRLQHRRRLALHRRADAPDRDGRRVVKEHGKHAVYANPRKPVPLAPRAQPIALTIPRDGRLVPVGFKKTPQPAESPLT